MFYAKSTRTVISGQGEIERYAMYNKKKRAVMQTNTAEWLFRHRSAARRELKTEASWGEFLE